MKAAAFTFFLSGLTAVFAVPASAAPAGDLPMTAAFTDALGGYRDCVIGALDRSGLAKADAMASAAITACTANRDAVHQRLVLDIAAATPGIPAPRIAQQAHSGMAAIEPLIAAVAVGHAREILSAASANAPSLTRRKTIG